MTFHLISIRTSIGAAFYRTAIPFCCLLFALALMTAESAEAQENAQEYRRCELGTKQMNTDLLGKYTKPPANAPFSEQARLILALIKAELSHLDQNCTGWSGYTDYRKQRVAQYDQTLANCKSLNSNPSVCAPLFQFTAARVDVNGTVMTPASFGAGSSPQPGTSQQAATAQSRPAPTAPATVSLTPKDKLLTNYISSVASKSRTLLAGLSRDQQSLQMRWIDGRATSAMEQMSPGAALSKFPTIYQALVKKWRDNEETCKTDTTTNREICMNGAFFGTAADRYDIERAPNPIDPVRKPKLKRVAVRDANHCLTVDIKSLFGGFINSCDFRVMYVYCVENPPKSAWSDAFRCATGPRGVKALDLVGATETQGAHTHHGRVIFFACPWSATRSGEGPDGIWGDTVYNEGVGTPGIIRGTCGEQIYTP
jgi:hypothetical protein